MKSVTTALLMVCACIAQNPVTPKYPGAVATDRDLSVQKNAPSVPAQLGAGLTSSSTSVVLNTGDGLKFAIGQIISIDAEKMQISGISTDTLTVYSRGAFGTSNVSHASGTAVTGRAEDYAVNSVAAEVKAIETALGVSLANVAGGVTAGANNTWTGYNRFDTGRFSFPEATFASAPSTPLVRQVFLFSDASAAGVCSGGGSSKALCRYTGVGYESIGGGGASGITSLNGLTGASQTFAVGTAGSNFAISSSGTVHTFSLPTASASVRGALSSGDWSAFNAKQAALPWSTTGDLVWFNTGVPARLGATPGYLHWTGSAFVFDSPSGSGITVLSGDATTAAGGGPQALTLATVNSNVGTCGDATHVGRVTLDAKGRATACTAVTIAGTSGSSFCSSLITVVGQRITVPTGCFVKVSPDTTPVFSPASNYVDVPGGQTGVVLVYFDRGTFYFAHTLTAPTPGAGATLVPATSTIPVGAEAIASFSVSAGTIAAIVPKDGQTQNKITAAGNLQKTVGANGETVLTGTNFETIIGNSTASTETLSSTYCGGTRTFDNSVTLTLPPPGTAGFANTCRVALISRTTGVITMVTSGGSIYPTGANVIGAGKSAVIKTDGVDYFVETGSGGAGSGTTITTYVFTTTGSHNITCGTNGYIDAEGWGAGGSGGGGYFAGGSGGPGGGYGHRLGTCTPAATVVGVVGAGGTWTSGAGGGDGGDTTVASGTTLNVLGGKWPTTSTQLPGYDNTNTPSTRSYYYVEALLSNNDTTVRLLPYASVNLSGGTSTFAPGQEDLGGIGTGTVGASTAGPIGSPALSAGAGGGGGANSTTTHAGGAASKSRYCSSGAGGHVTASVGTAGAAGSAPGCAGGGGSYDGTVRGGGAGGDGKLIVRTW